MSKYSLSWFAMLVFAGFLTACGQNQDGGQGGMGADPGQQETPPPSEPGTPPANP